MIEKLNEYKITNRDGSFINVECNTKIINTLVRKINNLVDAVNGILDYAPLEMAMKAEPEKCETRAENVQDHRIRSTNERLREALSLAENALIRLANDACDMDEHIYIDTILSRIDAITKGGNNE